MKGQINVFVPKYVADNMEKIATANGMHISNLMRQLVNEINFDKKIPVVSFGNCEKEKSHYLAVVFSPRKLSYLEDVAKNNHTSVTNVVKYAMVEKGLIKKKDVKIK